MAIMKEHRKYYFSVEGETEQWYFKWLQDQINAESIAAYKVTFDCPKQKDPVKRAKSMAITGKTNITHVFDYESNDEVHTTQFLTALDRMKEAQSLGKDIKYHLGYSNFTFELWMVLHKQNCNGSLANRSQYLTHINSAFDENFIDLDHYKQECNFNRVLGKLSLNDVRQAITRARQITQRNDEFGYTLQQYKTFRYYRENPSLSIWESIEKILREGELI